RQNAQRHSARSRHVGADGDYSNLAFSHHRHLMISEVHMTSYRQRLSPSVIEAIMLPRIIRLSSNLYAATFVIMKLLPASFILDRARDAKLVHPGSVVIETTSGTFGIALAMVCNL